MSGIFTKSTASSLGALTDITGDDLNTITPSGGNIIFAGGANLSSTAVGSTLTYALAGTTDHAVQIGNVSGSLTSLGVGATDTVLIGSTGADPVFGQATNAALVNSSVTLNSGNNVTVTGSPLSLGGVATIDLSGTTNHTVQVGNASGALTSIAIGSTNTVLLGSTGADPSFGTVPNAALTNSDITLNDGDNITVTGSPISLGGTATIALSDMTEHSLQIGNASGSLTNLGVAANGQIPIGAMGANPVLATVSGGSNINIGNLPGSITVNLDSNVSINSLTLTTALTVPNGGTGQVSLTDHGLLVGSGAGDITPLGVATDGQLPIGSTGADPVVATLTEGIAIDVTNGAGSISIEVTGGGLDWVEVTGTSQSMAINTGYIANNAALVTLTLPSVAAVGDVLRIVGKGLGFWSIAQNAGQTLHFNDKDSTTGVGGSIDGDKQYSSINLVCITANTDFVVMGVAGDISVN